VLTPRHALVLAAGLGTRLHPLTLVRAKAALPVAGEAIVRRIARWLVGGGVTDVVVNLHHLPATIAAVLGDGSDLGARIRYSWEQPAILGSAGGPRQALPLIGVDRFLIVNGDVLTDVDLSALAAAHASSGALVTLALVPNREPLRYGGVLVDSATSVVGFVPRGAAAAGSFHFVGPQMVEAEAFQSAPMGRPMSSIGGLYNELIGARPGSVRAFVSDAPYWDIGTVADYWSTSLALQGRPLPGESIFWDDVRIGAGAILEECIVTDRVSVPAGTRYRRMILMNTRSGELVATPFETRR
jgi:NDP-sugar pyrophosphorylase family protein